MGNRCSTDIDEVENGYIVRVSHDKENGPSESKRFVAMTRPEAQSLAGAALSGKIKVGKKKGRRGGAVEGPAMHSPRKRARRKKAY